MTNTPTPWEPQIGDTVHIVETVIGDFTKCRRTTVTRITKTLVITATGDRFKRDSGTSRERALDLHGAHAYGSSSRTRLFPDGHETVTKARATLRMTILIRHATVTTQAATRSDASVADIDNAITALHDLRWWRSRRW